MDHFTQSARNHFTAYGLDRAHAYWRDAAWLDAQRARPTTHYLPVWQGRHLMTPGPTPHPVTLAFAEAAPLLTRATSQILLGTAGGHTYFAFEWPAGDDLSDALTARGEFLGLRQTAALLSDFDGGLLAYAGAIIYWHHTHRFCGVCGSISESMWAGHTRHCTNPQCGYQDFPRTDPAIIVCTTLGDRILLGRQPHWTPGRYSNIAGFVAPGESLEDAVVREVHEEANVQIKSVHYHSSQPWPFPRSLMVGFVAEAENDTLCVGETCSDGELEHARWFTRAEIRQGLASGKFGLPSQISISFHLIEDWFDAGHAGKLAPLKDMYDPD